MTEGIKLMKDLGFIIATNKHDSTERLFKRVDSKGIITETINYFYENITGVVVFTNSLKNASGCLLDNDLLNAVIINFKEFENEVYGLYDDNDDVTDDFDDMFLDDNDYDELLQEALNDYNETKEKEQEK